MIIPSRRRAPQAARSAKTNKCRLPVTLQESVFRNKKEEYSEIRDPEIVTCKDQFTGLSRQCNPNTRQDTRPSSSESLIRDPRDFLSCRSQRKVPHCALSYISIDKIRRKGVKIERANDHLDIDRLPVCPLCVSARSRPSFLFFSRFFWRIDADVYFVLRQVTY